MSKKRFIQTVIARSLPSQDKREAALTYAEDLWAWLTHKGYGDDKPTQPRESKDWYNTLNERQRRWFDGFWLAFDYKKDREGAAMRWFQLGELADADYQQIIDAATKEARSELPPGQARKMAQGWLSDKRYLDTVPVKSTLKSAKNLALQNLENNLKALQTLYEGGKDPALLPQIDKLKAAIAEAKKCPSQMYAENRDYRG